MTQSRSATRTLGQPTVLVIFGISGDLARKKLLPALLHLYRAGRLPAGRFHVVGVSRQDLLVDDVLAGLRGLMKPKEYARFAKLFGMFRMDLTEGADYVRLADILKKYDRPGGQRAQRIFYLSMPPQVTGPVIDLLGAAGLHKPRRHTRLLLEKPFGYDLESARELVGRLATQFTEPQLYRIDHYLAKETAQNILVFRFSNPIFQALWHRRAIERVEITASEEIGIEGRSVFYEQVGALRDLIQSHLLQVMSLVAMEEPSRLTPPRIRAEKLKLLRALEPADPAQAVRGQYEGYLDEVHNDESYVETFAAVKVFVRNRRWQGVPFVIRTGKRLAEKLTEVRIVFKDPHTGKAAGNDVVIKLQPDEGIGLTIRAKQPGLDNRTEPVEMDFRYARSFADRQPDAYERVLFDAIRGDQSLFTGSEEVLAAWRAVEPVVQAWTASGRGLTRYEPGTPAADLSETLL